MGKSARDKLNQIWFWIALAIAVIIGYTFNSCAVFVITFGIVFAVLIYSGDVRLNSSDLTNKGRKRRP